MTLSDQELKKREVPIPLYDAKKGMVRMQISPPDNARPVTPDGVVIHEYYPVLLAPDLRLQIQVLNASITTTKKWVEGTAFWKALAKHVQDTSGTIACIFQTNCKHWHISLSYREQIVPNADGIHISLSVCLEGDMNHRNIFVPSSLLTNFKQSGFNKWVKKIVDANKKNAAYSSVYSSLRAEITSGRLTFDAIKDMLNDIERDMRDSLSMEM